ncbi:MAG: beta-galactosidase trimerization domain-containing protein [Spirochaetia bacterium]
MYYGVRYYPEHWPEERWKTDAVSPWDSLDGYRLVIAPRLWTVPTETADRLREFVRNGGTLVLPTTRKKASPWRVR